MAHKPAPKSGDDVAVALKEVRDALANLALTQAGQAAEMAYGFKEMTSKQDITNGNLHKHDARLELLEAWRRMQALEEAHDAGVAEGQTKLRARDYAILGAFLTVAVAIAPNVPRLLDYLR